MAEPLAEDVAVLAAALVSVTNNPDPYIDGKGTVAEVPA